MEKNRKELKSFSIVILALTALSLVSSIVRLCVGGVPQIGEIPAGVSKELVQIVSIIVFAIGFIGILPQIYMGVKGIKIANGAPSGKAHIVWALIFVILSALSVFSGISGLIKAFNIDTVVDFLYPIVDLALYGLYYMYAVKVKKEG